LEDSPNGYQHGEGRPRGREFRKGRSLYAIEHALSDQAVEWNACLRRVLATLTDAFRFADQAGARVQLGDQIEVTPGFKPTPWALSSPVMGGENSTGKLEVAFQSEPPAHAVPFVDEEREFLNLIAARLGESWRNRLQAEQIRLLDAAFHAVTNAVVITDRDGRIQLVNSAFTANTGYPAEEAVGKTPGALLRSGEHDDAFYADLWETILRGEPWRGRLINRRKDGSLFPEEQTITPVKDPSGEISHFIAVKVDRSERERLELDLRQAQRMEATGQLAAVLAHDFNNLLTSIRGHSEMVVADLPPGSPLTLDLREVLKEVDRGSELSRQLLAFGRKEDPRHRVVDLASVLGDIEPMLRRLLPERIHLRFLAEGGPLQTRGNPGELHQVLLNLALNARDAIPEAGEITFHVRERSIEREDVVGVTAQVEPGLFAELRVTDTGVGIPDDVMPRIFDAFFTTKPEGRGTGLGLLSVLRIVKQRGGHVLVESSAQAGTSFQLLFPLLKPEPPETGQASQRVTEAHATTEGGVPAPAEGAGRTLLVVEDESSVRRMIGRALERAGYVVLFAGEGRTALRLAQEHRTSIELVLSDVNMPVMGGEELLRELHRAIPGVRVILMSGYSGDELSAVVQENAWAILEKPFSLETLKDLVHQAFQEVT